MTATASRVSPYTTHGHLVPGFTDEGWDGPLAVARCGGVELCGTCALDAARIRIANDVAAVSGEAPASSAIDADPEFFYGLTMWVDGTSAQVRDTTVVVHAMQTRDVFVRPVAGEVEMSHTAARRLRDLLNVATARGMLS
jgi:hypothetical protein